MAWSARRCSEVFENCVPRGAGSRLFRLRSNSDEGYATVTTVGVGEKLPLPDPFGITLDTSALPLPR